MIFDIAVHVLQGSPIRSHQLLGARMELINAPASQYMSTVAELLKAGRNAVMISNENHFDVALALCGTIIAVKKLGSREVASLALSKNSKLTAKFQEK